MRGLVQNEIIFRKTSRRIVRPGRKGSPARNELGGKEPRFSEPNPHTSRNARASYTYHLRVSPVVKCVELSRLSVKCLIDLHLTALRAGKPQAKISLSPTGICVRSFVFFTR